MSRRGLDFWAWSRRLSSLLDVEFLDSISLLYVIHVFDEI